VIPHVTRGDRMAGLMNYLVGPGRHNQHEDQHLVAGDPVMLTWFDDNHLDEPAGVAIARYLDEPSKAYGVSVNGGHVWHCSLSLAAEEGQLSDEKWQEIADDFVAGMGFDDAEETKASCRWVAVRHGLSGNGNDHVHIAVNLVREDGTKASIHNDFKRAQKVARGLEEMHGLEPLESLTADRSTRSYGEADRGEMYDAAESGAVRAAKAKHDALVAGGAKVAAWDALSGPERQARILAALEVDRPRFVLERAVRGAAAAAGDEAEFVRRLRKAGVMVRPRFAEGSTDVVTGYAVGTRPSDGSRPQWFGAGQLDKGLRLPQLRKQWESSPASTAAAAAEWTAAKRNQRPVAPGAEAAEVDPQLLHECAAEIGELRERLRAVPVTDQATWSQVARQTAGAFAAWSNRVESTPGPMARTADVLVRASKPQGLRAKPVATRTVAIGQAARLLAAASKPGDSRAAQLAVLMELANLAKAIHDTVKANEKQRHAAEIVATRRVHLQTVMDRLAPSEQQSAVATLERDERATVSDILAASAPDRSSQPGAASTDPRVLPAHLQPAPKPTHSMPGPEGPDVGR
jgi:hypothetical protein